MFKVRRIYLMKEKTEVGTYLKSHACCLQIDRALELFESNFICLYPESLLLLLNWSKARNFLIKKLSTLKITNVEM